MGMNSSKTENGVLTISLDFELYWGMRDHLSIEQYQDNLVHVRRAVQEMLQVFSEHQIHVTWATVGFLFFKDSDELQENFPTHLPQYTSKELSPYRYIQESSQLEYLYHFAPDTIDLIRQYPGQEIATHTFSHYYCVESGQTIVDFEADILSAIKIATARDIDIKSIVFPRNQSNPDYLSMLAKLGIQCYRGNESSWIYQSSEHASQGNFQRALRLIDTYFNITGHHTYNLQDCLSAMPFNFPSSRFIRPFSHKLSRLDGLRLRRIKKAMDDAAKKNRLYHIWWHPHNFGTNTTENIEFLKKIIFHYKKLQKEYNMKSMNMGELCSLSSRSNLKDLPMLPSDSSSLIAMPKKSTINSVI